MEQVIYFILIVLIIYSSMKEKKRKQTEDLEKFFKDYDINDIYK